MNKREIEQLKPVKFIQAVVLLVIILILVTMAMKCQGQERFSPFGIFGGGLTPIEPSVELHAGAIFRNVTASIGYNVIIDSGAPSMFQLRAGYLFGIVHVYGGPVRIHYNGHGVLRNYWTGNIGAQVHLVKYDNGTMYVTAGYSPRFPTIGVGMTFHFIKSPK